ncbi:copper resistance CopC family protein [Microbacterium indicum]|uniref:copper resistance CopC family protein n=1 Tax=Microbacterium indicum TaxID=358100 RepID=UPI00146BCC9C|nr:copper resistance CopC family protein [Microbacterium indicum]
MTDTRTRSPRSLAARIVGAASLAAALVLTASPAFAHSDLVATSPAEGATLDVVPAEVSLTFSDDLLAEGAAEIQVFDETCADAGLLIANPGMADTRDCRNYASGDPVVTGPTITQALDRTDAVAGTYTVVWRVTYGDAHSGEDLFTFTASGAAPAEPSDDPSPTETALPADPSASAEPTTPAETTDPATAAPSATATASPSPTATASPTPAADASSGVSAPLVIGIVAGVVVLALIVFIVVMIVRARRN